MAASHLLRFSLLPSHFPSSRPNSNPQPRLLLSSSLPSSFPSRPNNLSLPHATIDSLSGSGTGGGGSKGLGGGGDGSDGWGSGSGGESSESTTFFPLGLFLNGWRSRVAADPQFPFKVLMEEVVGLSSCVLGDMATRPNFGLQELDFVFSTLVVGSILNFVLMYLLAPTSGAAASSSLLPGLFSQCPPGHMFEIGPYSPIQRLGTLAYKGAVFGTVGLFAGLAGTAISNGLISFRKRLDPGFESPNKPPPTILNAFTWALHMGVSSNFRYQSLNGVEFLLARAASPAIFKSSVIALRCANNVLGGASFVLLAKLTGSQKVDEEEKVKKLEDEDKADAIIFDVEREDVDPRK